MKNIKLLSVVAAVCLMLFSGILFTACKDDSLTINFESNGGTACSPIEYTQDSALILPEPTREEYLFGGWYEDDGTWEQKFEQSNLNSYIDNNSLTLYAKWLKKVNLVFVSDDNFDDIYLDSLDIVLPTPTRDGYTFDCWCVDIELTKPYTIETVVEADSYNEVYLYPRWETSKTIYYYNDIGVTFDKISDVVAVGERITLYQPDVPFYHFDGWFYDYAYTEPVPNRISNDMLKNKDNVLYAKFTQKVIKAVKVIGAIKTEYGYGENFDAGTGKLLIQYADKQFEDEIVDISSNMVSGFYLLNNDFGSGVVITPNFTYTLEMAAEEAKNADRAYYSTMCLVVMDHNGEVLGKTDGIRYKVNSDIETFTINNIPTFEFGEDSSIEEKGIVISWTDINGNTGMENLTSDTDFSVKNLITEKIGTYKFSLTYHFRTLEFEYMVNDVNITSGYVEKGARDNPILLNGYAKLIEQDIYLYNPNTGENVFYVGLTEDDIIEDIDTSTAGEQFAKINVNGHEVSIRYYVVDLDKVQYAVIPTAYNKNSPSYTSSFTAEFTMEDGEVFEQYFYSFLSIQTPNIYIISGIDVSTVGTKYVIVSYFGYQFYIEYTVK